MYYYYIRFSAGNDSSIGCVELGLNQKIEYFSDLEEIKRHIAQKTGHKEETIIIDSIYPMKGIQRP